MRTSLIAALLTATLIAACSTTGDVPPSKHISQSGQLKVHPGLLSPATANRTPETPKQ